MFWALLSFFFSGGDEHNVCSGRPVTPLALSPCDAFQCFALCGDSLLHCTVPHARVCVAYCVLVYCVSVANREPCPEWRDGTVPCASARTPPEMSRFQSSRQTCTKHKTSYAGRQVSAQVPTYLSKVILMSVVVLDWGLCDG